MVWGEKNRITCQDPLDLGADLTGLGGLNKGGWSRKSAN